MTLAPIQLRRNPKVTWEGLNPVLSAGEPGFITDTGELKIGDGSTPWLDLPTLATVDNVADLEATVDILLGRIGEIDIAFDEIELSVADAEAARAGSEAAKTEAEAARDLALAGQFAGSALAAGASLNTLVTPGVFHRNGTAGNTVANGYPYDNWAGVILVFRRTNVDRIIQVAYTLIGNAADPRVTYQRSLNAAGWTPWYAYASQRVVQTSGRAIYTWDDLNNREQLIFGDTGWCDIPETDLMNGWKFTSTGFLRIRRSNNQVFVWLYGLDPTITPASANIFYDLPVGFRPDSSMTAAVPSANNVTVESIRLGGSASRQLTMPGGGQIRFPSQGLLSPFFTVQSWPTALPGTPYGAIPNI